ncbi:sulfopyruvate decarboxylase subunit alpha/phosphonopyruvate decarboxylase [Salana multivorans]|uniref:Sulfopyruvate decarboxylase subunit alpha/phosphonopyruvate decarboxylase n=1 Tax=Salana multivorans TaxID=120377 RepID=A0A3N2DBH1_9MICO|nr:thiamine pyrophosphate-binding protein [Salana multivorans]ROR97150.1 sulfopyruvate decarboxylase subunit alpha/phosphonopyruvate decarboxylase [Salana multivorans]
MTVVSAADAADAPPGTRVATATWESLRAHRLGPYLATPDGILAPLLELLAAREDYRTVSREDNAVGIAAGIGLAGGSATVLMQNSGLGLAVNALASLVAPYRIPVLLVVSQRGTDADTTEENLAMGRLTAPVLDGLGIAHATLDATDLPGHVARAAVAVREERRPYALLVPPGLFGWRP